MRGILETIGNEQRGSGREEERRLMVGAEAASRVSSVELYRGLSLQRLLQKLKAGSRSGRRQRLQYWFKFRQMMSPGRMILILFSSATAAEQAHSGSWHLSVEVPSLGHRWQILAECGSRKLQQLATLTQTSFLGRSDGLCVGERNTERVRPRFNFNGTLTRYKQF